MKRFSLFLISLNLFSQEIKITPFFVLKNYGEKSFIKNSKITGFLYSKNKNGKTFQFSFSKTKDRFKNGYFPNFYQKDYTFLFKERKGDLLLKGGIHKAFVKSKIENQTAVIAGVKSFNQNFYTGIDFFYTFLKKSRSFQTTPYIGNYIFLSKNISNESKLFLDFIHFRKNFLAAGFKNTLFYKKISLSLEFEGGKLTNYIKDDGHSLYNVKDIVYKIVSISMGYENFYISFKKNYFYEYLGYRTNNKTFLISFTKYF